jgi:hypothetical protein
MHMDEPGRERRGGEGRGGEGGREGGYSLWFIGYGGPCECCEPRVHSELCMQYVVPPHCLYDMYLDVHRVYGMFAMANHYFPLYAIAKVP